MDLHLLKSIFVHNLLSQHLGTSTRLEVERCGVRGHKSGRTLALAQPWLQHKAVLPDLSGFPRRVGMCGHPGMPGTAPAAFCCHVTRLRMAAASLLAPSWVLPCWGKYLQPPCSQQAKCSARSHPMALAMLCFTRSHKRAWMWHKLFLSPSSLRTQCIPCL